MQQREWLVELSGTPVTELLASLGAGPMLEDGRYRLEEATVAVVGGLKIQVFANEHPPPHFRVYYNGDTANYAISDCRQLSGHLQRFSYNIKKWHSRNKPFLIAEWNRLRPSDCPVGVYREQE